MHACQMGVPFLLFARRMCEKSDPQSAHFLFYPIHIFVRLLTPFFPLFLFQPPSLLSLSHVFMLVRNEEEVCLKGGKSENKNE